MAYICTVVIEADLETVQRAEQERPDIMSGIGKAATGRMVGHTRYSRDGWTMDIDEFESREAYEEFAAEAGDLIRQYGEAVGAAPTDTVWRRVEQ